MSGDECIHRLPNFSLYYMYVACDENACGGSKPIENREIFWINNLCY